MSADTPPVRIDPRRVVNEMLMVRNQALALVRGIELTLADFGVLTPEDGLDGARVPSAPDDDGTCRHPRENRKPAPVMKHPHRFYCTACEEVLSGDEEV